MNKFTMFVAANTAGASAGRGRTRVPVIGGRGRLISVPTRRRR